MGKITQLKLLQTQALHAATRAGKYGEHEIAKEFLTIAGKLEQKIQGHKANKRRK